MDVISRLKYEFAAAVFAAGALMGNLCITLAAQEENKTPRPCIAVMDFINPDITGQQSFLNFESKKIKIDENCTLQDPDRVTMNSVMQGYVRMIDAQDITNTNTANRAMLLKDNEFDREKTLDLYKTVVKGEIRPLLIGADYLTAALNQQPGILSTLSAQTILQTMSKLQQEPDFPSDFMLRLAQETGATHLAYGTIADIHSKLKTYKGYNIETKVLLYELDVIIKIADLPAQKIVYSKVYTGVLKEQDMSTGGLEIDLNKYQTLMKSAMAQAGEDLLARFNQEKSDCIKVTPIPPKKAKAAELETKEKADDASKKGSVQKVYIPVSADPRNETVIIRQDSNVIRDEHGIPVAPVPPAVTPVVSDSKATVVIQSEPRTTPIVRQEIKVQREIGESEK